MKKSSDIEVLQELIADGHGAVKGDCIRYSARMYLRRGEEVTRDYEMIARYGDRVPTRLVAGVELVEHTTVLGKRQALAGVERMLTGLSPGSFREAMIPPHLAYRDKGVKNLIPPNAMLRVQVWVHAVEAEDWRTRELR